MPLGIVLGCCRRVWGGIFTSGALESMIEDHSHQVKVGGLQVRYLIEGHETGCPVVPMR